jgi:hypothetical protein
MWLAAYHHPVQRLRMCGVTPTSALLVWLHDLHRDNVTFTFTNPLWQTSFLIQKITIKFSSIIFSRLYNARRVLKCHTEALWVMTYCSLVGWYHRFGRQYCLHLQKTYSNKEGHNTQSHSRLEVQNPHKSVNYFRKWDTWGGHFLRHLFHAMCEADVLPVSGSCKSRPSCALGSETHHFLVQRLPKLSRISVGHCAI